MIDDTQVPVANELFTSNHYTLLPRLTPSLVYPQTAVPSDSMLKISPLSPPLASHMVVSSSFNVAKTTDMVIPDSSSAPDGPSMSARRASRIVKKK